MAVGRAYLAGGGDFPERVAMHLLVGRFLPDYYDMILRWVDWGDRDHRGLARRRVSRHS